MRHPFRIESSAGHPIRGEVRAPRDGRDRGTVILCHGFKGFWDWGGFPHALDAAAARGFFAVGFSFSGSGVSQGDRVDEPERFADNTISREVADLGDVVYALRTGRLAPPGRDPGPIGLIGHSFGGGVAILYAADDAEIRAVVGWAPIASGERFSPDEVARWRRDGWLPVVNARTGQELRLSTAFLDDIETNRERLDIPAAAARLSARLLLLHGDADESVPLAESKAIAARARPDGTQLIAIPGGTHTFGVSHPFAGSTTLYDLVVSVTLDWMESALRR
jgi:pimeloyl-ACP methyl ester carboxylesterase